MQPIRSTRAAAIFLTRIPVGGARLSDDDWRWAPAFFPIVGAVVGLFAGVCHSLVLPLGTWPAAIVCVAISILITGALHEDGLADTADALGGSSHDPSRLQEILKDSRLGTFGVTALVLSLMLRTALITELGTGAAVALVTAHALSRIPPVWQLATQPYITQPDEIRSGAIINGGVAQAGVATILGAGLLVILAASNDLSFASAITLTVSLAFVSLFTAWRYTARAGGICGDFLGATQQLCEVTVLAVFVLMGGAS